MSEEIKKTELKSIKFQVASVPVYSEVLQRSPWVYYGENNLLPQYFIELYDNCAIHKAVVTSKVNQIMGDGIVSLNNPMATVNLVFFIFSYIEIKLCYIYKRGNKTNW